MVRLPKHVFILGCDGLFSEINERLECLSDEPEKCSKITNLLKALLDVKQNLIVIRRVGDVFRKEFVFATKWSIIGRHDAVLALLGPLLVNRISSTF